MIKWTVQVTLKKPETVKCVWTTKPEFVKIFLPKLETEWNGSRSRGTA